MTCPCRSRHTADMTDADDAPVTLSYSSRMSVPRPKNSSACSRENGLRCRNGSSSVPGPIFNFGRPNVGSFASAGRFQAPAVSLAPGRK